VREPDNSPASQAQANYNEAYWKYQREVIDHTRKVYEWQHISSIIIFYVVIFLVLVGVGFSWLQFKAAAYKGESEELDASMKGVKITSSTLGVVILVLSMCFFYLYLRYVYPVNVNEGAGMVTSVETTASH
jgi:glucose uptake protein GlcU